MLLRDILSLYIRARWDFAHKLWVVQARKIQCVLQMCKNFSCSSNGLEIGLCPLCRPTAAVGPFVVDEFHFRRFPRRSLMPPRQEHRPGRKRAETMTAQELLQQISDFCRHAGLAESTFGRRAVNDGKLANLLRNGGRITTETVDRIQAFMEAKRNTGLVRTYH